MTVINRHTPPAIVYNGFPKAETNPEDPYGTVTTQTDAQLLPDVLTILCDKSTDEHEKIERLRSALLPSGYADMPGSEKMKIDRALDKMAVLYRHIAAKNKTSVVSASDLSLLQRAISTQLDIIKSCIKENNQNQRFKSAALSSVLPAPSASPVPSATPSPSGAEVGLPPPPPPPPVLTTGTSYAELWAVIAQAIGSIKTNYLDFYSSLLQKYESMYESYNDNVQKASSEAVNSGGDSNKVSFDATHMDAGYTAFNDYVKNTTLDSVPGWAKMTQTQKDSIKSNLAPSFSVDENGGVKFDLSQYNTVAQHGEYVSSDFLEKVTEGNNIPNLEKDIKTHFGITFDFSHLTVSGGKKALSDLLDKCNALIRNDPFKYLDARRFLDYVENAVNHWDDYVKKYNTDNNSKYPAGIELPKSDVSTPSYQAWLATFNAVGSTLQSNLNSFSQRYTQANSTYDNLNKVLSGAISSLSEQAKTVFKDL